MADELSSAKKPKLEPVNVIQGSSLQENQQQPNIFHSPVTEPMLLPEMWGQVFEHLSPDELQTVINTTPEWNQLLHSRKPEILFPKVLACMRDKLSWKDAFSMRMVCKACVTGVETAYPEIQVALRAQENFRRVLDGLWPRIRLGLRRAAINEQRLAQGLPELEFREGEEEEEVPEDEFSEEEIRAYLIRRFQPRPQI